MPRNKFDANMLANFSGISINIINNEEGSTKVDNEHRHKLQEIWKEVDKEKAQMMIISSLIMEMGAQYRGS